ncbi:MAG: hypothetical protein KHX52_14025, partial [Phocaeicola plebeius]|uniref:hypothetical protein n=1 Tax=Phocaeicola plebeius TaxID=310297 RepID=UPI00241CC2F2
YCKCALFDQQKPERNPAKFSLLTGSALATARALSGGHILSIHFFHFSANKNRNEIRHWLCKYRKNFEKRGDITL